MTHYPLLFTFLDKVEGNDYLAGVAVHGRLLAEQDGDSWWMFGVNPGGLAASGASRVEAYVEYRKTLMQVLFDIAERAKTFYAFRSEAKRFFEESNGPALAEWEAAREQVRAGKVNIEGLRQEKSESPRRIEVKLREKFAAKSNKTDSLATVAA